MCHHAQLLRQGGLSRQSPVDSCVSQDQALPALAPQVIKAQQMQGTGMCLTRLTPASRWHHYSLPHGTFQAPPKCMLNNGEPIKGSFRFRDLVFVYKIHLTSLRMLSSWRL